MKCDHRLCDINRSNVNAFFHLGTMLLTVTHHCTAWPVKAVSKTTITVRKRHRLPRMCELSRTRNITLKRMLCRNYGTAVILVLKDFVYYCLVI